MGLGLLGRGIGDAAFLAQHGAELVVTDKKTETELQGALEQLGSFSHITYRLGEHAEADFTEKDLILKGAGVPLDSPYIAAARKAGVPVDMSASLFARIAQGCTMVGVTGTRGKSTVVHLLHAMLQAAGTNAFLGGNVRGVSNLQLLAEVTPEHVGVFELDSWQLQGFGESVSLQHQSVRQGAHSPRVAVFTTFMPDHMNYYHDDMEAYFHDKAHIFLHQEPGDVLVVGKDVLPWIEKYKKDIRADVVVASASDVPKKWRVQLVGEHNRNNIGVALATARALGVDEDVLEQVMADFRAIPGRLEEVGRVAGVPVYNDTNATTPDAAAAALAALDKEHKKTIVLIAGGTSKNLNPQVFADAIHKHAHAVVLLPGTGTEELLPLLDAKATRVQRADTLEEAFDVGVDVGVDVGIDVEAILFSPGFTSFGLFKNEYDRGEQFVRLVEQHGAV